MREIVRRAVAAWSIILTTGVLVAAVGIRAAELASEKARARPAHLHTAMPAALTGWSQRDVPLGPTEFVAGEVEKVLKYDEVINREYHRSGSQIGLYIAYWGPGKMPTRMVASHTPDRCWTENGWRCVDMKFKFDPSASGVSLLPAEWRIFEPPRGERRTYVLYWHLVEGKPYDYGERFNAVPDPISWWRDAIQQAVSGSREQYFIRLTSDEPWEQIWHDPGVKALLHAIEDVARNAVTGF